MKKKLILLVFGVIMFSVAGFAQDREDHFEIGGSFFVSNSPDPLFSDYFGGGLNFGGVRYFWDKIGIGCYVNISAAFPYDEVLILDVDILAGPVFRLIQNYRFNIPIVAGVYLERATMYGTSIATRDLSIGAGLGVSIEYYLAEKFYLYGRVQGCYGIYMEELRVTPSIGVGFGGV
ncbi:MAG: hypothetical protein LBC27_08130 [Spirochaetaceae bacterium]|jgi:hypothetical protein|nr:hypothetical protein [Spirochaetaceae bacterium]